MKVIIIALSLLVVVRASAPMSLGDRLVMNTFKQLQMPLTTADATAQNWTLLNTACDPAYGMRYRMGSRLTPTLLFNAQGRLAGFQIVVDTRNYPLYPVSNLRPQPALPSQTNGTALNPHMRAVSFYTRDPNMICSSSGSSSQVLGDRLWMRMTMASQAQADFEVIPLREAEMVAGMPTNGYTLGACAPSGFAFPGSPGMGTHYWRYTGHKDSVCMDAGPHFVLYSKNVISAVGISFIASQLKVPTTGGVRPNATGAGPPQTPANVVWETPIQPLYPFFFTKEQNPTCLQNINTYNTSLPGGDVTVGTIHIYFQDLYTITCDALPSSQTQTSSSKSPTAWIIAFVVALIIAAVLVVVVVRGRGGRSQDIASQSLNGHTPYATLE